MFIPDSVCHSPDFSSEDDAECEEDEDEMEMREQSTGGGERHNEKEMTISYVYKC